MDNVRLSAFLFFSVMNEDWQRLSEVIKWSGMTTNAFAFYIGCSRGEVLYRIKRGQNRLSKRVATMVAEKYPQISKGWLLTGEGGMFKER